MAIVNSWCELAPEKLETDETPILVAMILMRSRHSKKTADGRSEEGGNYVKSSRRDLCKVGCKALDSESDKEEQ